MHNINPQSGFIKMIIVIIIALFILSYFGFDLEKAIKDPKTQKNFNYVERVVLAVWQNILKKPVMYLWHVFIDLIWTPAIHNLEKIRDGKIATFNTGGPQLPEARN